MSVSDSEMKGVGPAAAANPFHHNHHHNNISGSQNYPTSGSEGESNSRISRNGSKISRHTSVSLSLGSKVSLRASQLSSSSRQNRAKGDAAAIAMGVLTAPHPEDPDEEKLGGGYLPILTLFIIGGLASLAATITAGFFLYQFASNTVQDTIVAQGYSQIDALSARMEPEIRLMEETIDEHKSTITAAIQRHGPIENYTMAEQVLNASVMLGVPARITEEHNLAGMGILAILPPGTHPTEANDTFMVNVYYEPKRDGSRGYIYETMKRSAPSTRYARELTFEHVLMPSGETTTAENPSAIRVPVIKNEELWEESEYIEWYIQAETEFNYKTRLPLEPWASSFDGFPYWYMEMYEYFQVGDSWFASFNYKYLTRLTDVVAEVLRDSQGVKKAGSEIFVYQPINRAIAGTSYLPESNRSTNCYGSLGDFTEKGIDCLYLPPEESPFPLVRDLFAAVEDSRTWPIINASVASTSSKHTLDGKEYFVVTRLLVNSGAQRIMVIWIREAELELQEMRRDVIDVVAICCGCIGGASILTVILSYFGILKPLELLSEDMDALAKLETERFLGAGNGKKMSGSAFVEVQRLQSHFHGMAKALHSFGLYVPRDVVKEVLLDPTKMTLTMERRELAVMFADIAGFTTLSERFDGDKDFLGHIMAHFFRESTKIVHKNGGTIDKFIGDCIMAFWGAPLAVDEPCTRAICAGLELLQVGPEISSAYSGRDVMMWLRIGVNFGNCLCGNTGSEERMNYTALGDVVNTASRMEGANKDYGSSFMISREVLNKCGRGELLCQRNLGYVPMRGKLQSIEGFEVFAFTKKKVELPQPKTDRTKVTDAMSQHNDNEGAMSQQEHRSHQTGQQTDDEQISRLSYQRATTQDPANAEEEIAQLYKRRTGMLTAVESMEALMRTSAPPERLLHGCALNNLAVAAEQSDLRAAEELYNSAFQMIQAELRSTHEVPAHLAIQMKMFGLDLSASVSRIANALSNPMSNNAHMRLVGANNTAPEVLPYSSNDLVDLDRMEQE